MKIANTPPPPYYAVIFTAFPSTTLDGYHKMAQDMIELAKNQNGLLGYESSNENIEITISYWKDIESIRNWKENTEHKIAQQKGKSHWYESFKVRITKVERDYGFNL